ncbi:MAG TPA: hypothetical protein EYQ50_09785 [Verrucomicrobiales bacterium]|jgi:hypothetical protein|nr:hypothetical protein [Verrucomicrobiales bacterium]HIL69941.1 hypothetical protein [Verrucomicrobiota bacterium]
MDSKDRRIAELEEEVRQLKTLLEESSVIKVRKKKPLPRSGRIQSVYSIVERARQRSWNESFSGMQFSLALIFLSMVLLLIIPVAGWFQNNWHVIEQKLFGG